MENNEMEFDVMEDVAEAMVEETVPPMSTGKKVGIALGVTAVVAGVGLLGRYIYKKCEPKINEYHARKLERKGYSVTRPAVETNVEYVEYDHESEG
jgi:hypothetical protein